MYSDVCVAEYTIYKECCGSRGLQGKVEKVKAEKCRSKRMGGYTGFEIKIFSKNTMRGPQARPLKKKKKKRSAFDTFDKDRMD